MYTNGIKLRTRYLHVRGPSVNSAHLVNMYQRVSRGQLIAYSSNTGAASSSGPNYHLHLDINKADTNSPRYDPPTNVRDTLSPGIFWSCSCDSTSGTSIDVSEVHEDDIDTSLIAPEHKFDYRIILRVGIEEFHKWSSSLPASERTMTHFKEKYNLTDSMITDLMK